MTSVDAPRPAAREQLPVLAGQVAVPDLVGAAGDPVAMARSALGPARTGGHHVLILDTAHDPRLEYPAETVAEGIKSLLSLPIVARQRVVGVLRLYSAEQRRYRPEEATFLLALAEIAGVAIMNAKLYEKTRNDLSFWAATLGYMQD